MILSPVTEGAELCISIGHGAIDDFRLTIDYCNSPQRAQRAESKQKTEDSMQ